MEDAVLLKAFDLACNYLEKRVCVFIEDKTHKCKDESKKCSDCWKEYLIEKAMNQKAKQPTQAEREAFWRNE